MLAYIIFCDVVIFALPGIILYLMMGIILYLMMLKYLYKSHGVHGKIKINQTK